MSMNTGKAVRSAVLTALLLLAGCFAPSPEKENFDLISSHLERGGSVYTIRYTAPFKEEFAAWVESADTAVKASQIPHSRKMEFRRCLSGAELIWNLSGLNDIAGWGESSVPYGGNPYYNVSNRIFISVPQQSENLLNELLPAENQNAGEIIASLPAATDLAVGVYLRPTAVMKALQKSGRVGEDILNSTTAVPWPDWLAGCEGWWVSAVIFPETENLNSFKWLISFPDREKKVFSFLSAAFSPIAFKKDGKNRLAATGFLQRAMNGLALSVLHKSGRTEIYLPVESEKYFNTAGIKKLGSHPDYAKIVPASSAAVAFAIAPQKKSYPECVSKYTFSGFELLRPEGVSDDNFIAFLKREKSGWLLQDFANRDIQLARFYAIMSAIELLTPEKWSFFNAAERQNKPGPDGELVRIQITRECFTKHFPAIYDALKKYAGKHGGRFPDRPGFEGFQQLVDTGDIDMSVLNRGKEASGKRVSAQNCSFLYFGDIPVSGAKKLLAIDRPDNHNDIFHALYDDKLQTISEYKLERADSCRRIISYLHTVNQWPEEYFFKLMKQAEIFDGEIAKEKGRE